MRYSSVILTLIFIILSFTVIFLLFGSLDRCSTEVNSVHQTVKLSGKKTVEFYLIIVILSSLSNSKQRNVLRNTWLKTCNELNVKYYFVVGTKFIAKSDADFINNENGSFKDLIMLENIQDSYNNLTSKMLETLVWLDKNMKYKYALKCDDDSFVNVQELVQLLKDYEDDHRYLYLGFFNGHATVQKAGKWKESKWVLCDYYLPYALGGGYVLAHELVTFIAGNAKDLELFQSEDISVGVWLAGKANVNRAHSPRFNTEFKSRGCSNSYVVSHKHTEEEQEKLYHNLVSTGKMCEKEVRSRLSYNYNWNVPPSKCCSRTDKYP